MHPTLPSQDVLETHLSKRGTCPAHPFAILLKSTIVGFILYHILISRSKNKPWSKKQTSQVKSTLRSVSPLHEHIGFWVVELTTNTTSIYLVNEGVDLQTQCLSLKTCEDGNPTTAHQVISRTSTQNEQVRYISQCLAFHTIRRHKNRASFSASSASL